MPSKIIEDLTHIPNIIAGLGLSIAEAQRHFDLEYLQSLERLIVMAQSLLGGRKAQDGHASVEMTADEKQRLDQSQSMIKEFLMALAPSRYQFTETTLTVKLDLAQHLDVSAGAGLSAGIGGVAINASVSIGYGSDYRGAAECRTVLHAIPADQAMLRTLLDRAKDLSASSQPLPERSKVDTEVQAQSGRIFERMVGCKPATDAAAGTTATTSTPSTAATAVAAPATLGTAAIADLVSNKTSLPTAG